MTGRFGLRELITNHVAGLVAGTFVLSFAAGDPWVLGSGGGLLALHAGLLSALIARPWAPNAALHLSLQRNLSAPFSLMASLTVSVRLLPDYVYMIALFWTLAGALFNFFVFRSQFVSVFLGFYLLAASLVGASVGEHPPFLLGSLLFLSVSTAFMLAHQREVLAHLEATIDTKEKEVERVTYYDLATGLPNRLLFRERLVDAASRMAAFAVIAIDIDQASSLRQRLDAAGWTLLLRYVGSRLTGHTDEFVAFGGGERFFVLAPDDGDASGRAHRLLDAVHTDYHIGQEVLRVTGTAGISRYPVHSQEPDRLIVKAEAALSLARDAPTGRVSNFDPTRGTGSPASPELAVELLRAPLGDFRVHYQAKVDRLGRVIGCEALLRWQHPTLGLLNAEAFVHALERMDRVVDVGEWALFTALSDMRKLRSEVGLRVAVNVSPRQLQDPKLADKVLGLIEKRGGTVLELEVTEGTLLRDVGQAVDALRGLRSHGVRVSIADFGTSYSSLTRLIALPFDTVKIDRGFVAELGKSAQADALVRLIITLARQMGKETLADGVETAAQHRFLMDAGCDSFQGYLFAEPEPYGALKARLEGEAFV